MAIQEKVLWKKWAENLRMEMMSGLQPHTTKSIQEITEETQTTKSPQTLRTPRFWKDCQSGKGPQGSLIAAGFMIEVVSTEDRSIDAITLRLNSTWMDILKPVMDRKNVSA